MLKSLTRNVFGIALTWVLILVATFALLHWYSQPSAEREVPDLSGVSMYEASKRLADLGLQEIWHDSIYAPSGKPGTVVEQHPPPGSAVKAGRHILLTTFRITPPSERVGIDEGQDARIATRILETRGFQVNVKEEPNTLLAGKVLRVEHLGQRLDLDARHPKGTKLTLVVGIASAKDVRVPWLVGLSLKDAQGILARRKLALGHVGYAADVTSLLDSSLAVVMSQDVSPGTQPYVAEGTAIDLYLGKH